MSSKARAHWQTILPLSCSGSWKVIPSACPRGMMVLFVSESLFLCRCTRSNSHFVQRHSSRSVHGNESMSSFVVGGGLFRLFRDKVRFSLGTHEDSV
jgi:hypothetical protein